MIFLFFGTSLALLEAELAPFKDWEETGDICSSSCHRERLLSNSRVASLKQIVIIIIKCRQFLTVLINMAMSGGDCKLSPNGSLLFPKIAWRKSQTTTKRGRDVINENCTNDKGLWNHWKRRVELKNHTPSKAEKSYDIKKVQSWSFEPSCQCSGA